MCEAGNYDDKAITEAIDITNDNSSRKRKTFDLNWYIGTGYRNFYNATIQILTVATTSNQFVIKFIGFWANLIYTFAIFSPADWPIDWNTTLCYDSKKHLTVIPLTVECCQFLRHVEHISIESFVKTKQNKATKKGTTNNKKVLCMNAYFCFFIRIKRNSSIKVNNVLAFSARSNAINWHYNDENTWH